MQHHPGHPESAHKSASARAGVPPRALSRAGAARGNSHARSKLVQTLREREINQQPTCTLKSLPLDITGYTAHQLIRKLKTRLANKLQSKTSSAAFLDLNPKEIYPRADELEDMIALYPDPHLLDFENEPTCPATTVKPDKWIHYHSAHCTKGCSPTRPASN